ncbi:2,3-dihydro-2,3-dihydroxybenzoate dehydrogenase [Uliginosibacterium sp. H3]|uniref:2,3-dihydro-2,3-dihydroxybenzoate dehydrogenase n=1 Tax=Uliginosibacterium silvisoli TaxID=3114758 RepID=A0ABU6K0G4_9RHOO|nr:2,3-dihydro-2,3-dihydroxybenzoate dehydrogenase [Uliginosibacterium sp. H3]
MNTQLEFHDKTALITGGAQGIGAAVARALAQQGARVALIDHQADKLETFAHALRTEGKQAIAIPLDLREGAAITAAVARTEQELGPIDLLVNVAGILRSGGALELGDADWEDSFAINTTAIFRMCRAVARGMVERKQGAIVTVGSNAARTPRLGMAAYAASKAATAHYMRCLALELAPHGIRCNTVSPGSTDTAMQRAFASTPEQIQSVLNGSLERYRLGIPLGRIATPEDIAEAVCFLASERARHITMHDLCVDGGATLGG